MTERQNPLDYRTPQQGGKPPEDWENREPANFWILAVALGVGLLGLGGILLLAHFGK